VSAYVIANLTLARPGPGAAGYLEQIDEVVAEHGGRFLVHGAPPEVLEGRWTGDTVVLEFPDGDHARAWYASSAYRRIRPLRTAHFDGPVVLIDGVPPGHRSTDLLDDGTVGPLPDAAAARPAVGATDRPAGGPRPVVTTQDGVRLAHDDLGSGPPVVLVHGWTLDRTAWEHQVAALAPTHRCIAYDRRGHGASDVPAAGYDADTLADDLAAVLEQLDLSDVTLVSHSMGSGDVVRYLRRHGPGRVARVAMLAPTTPITARTPSNPGGIDPELLAAGRAAFVRDRAAWFAERRDAYFRQVQEPGRASEAVADHTIRTCLATPPHVALACMDTMLRADFRDDLAALDLPVLILHGDADESTPLELCGRPTAALVPHATLKVYPGAGHGLYVTHQDEIAADLRRFLREDRAA
jgi:pimeloyl-ACP methyl ester carboxylesterase/uncharacterized protein (DUF1330 family)